MYLKTEITASWFERKSKTGKKHRYKTTKTIYYLSCDHCKTEIIRYKGDMDPKRFAKEYSHYCEKCFGQSAIKGQVSRRKNLDKMIGDRQIDHLGYPTIYVGKNYPYSKDYGGRIREHIIVMEKHLKRALKHTGVRDPTSEVVHHIDGDKTNNKVSNLQVMTQIQHNKCHAGNDALIIELYRSGLVSYDRRKKKYFIKEPLCL